MCLSFMMSIDRVVTILTVILFGTIGTTDAITVSLNGDDWLASNYNKCKAKSWPKTITASNPKL